MNLNQKAASISLTLSLSTLMMFSTSPAQAASGDPTPTKEPALQMAAVEGTSPKTETPALKNYYEVFSNQGLATLSVIQTWETGHTGVFINNKQVVRFRAEAAGYSPYQRAKVVNGRLYRFLLTGGNPRDIKPGIEKGQVVIRMGDDVLLTVDSENAALSQQPERTLALSWANQIREALGADAIVRNANMIASRSMAGAMDRDGLQEVAELDGYTSSGTVRTGIASWYGPGFHGRRAANGSRFDMNAMTAAHRTLPFGTMVRVINQRTGKSCIVKITDRGPFVGNRIIDLSKGAASAIGMLGSGVSKVTIEVLEPVLASQ